MDLNLSRWNQNDSEVVLMKKVWTCGMVRSAIFKKMKAKVT